MILAIVVLKAKLLMRVWQVVQGTMPGNRLDKGLSQHVKADAVEIMLSVQAAGARCDSGGRVVFASFEGAPGQQHHQPQHSGHQAASARQQAPGRVAGFE